MIYCHSDGYVLGVGQTLFNHYQDETKIDELLALGDISMLGEKIGEKHDFDSPFRGGLQIGSLEYQEFYNTVLAYGRDRGEKGVDAITVRSLRAIPKDFYEEGFYLRRDGKWFFSYHGTFGRVRELTPAIIAKEQAEYERRKAGA